MGMRVMDTITKFEGIIISITEHMYERVEYFIQPCKLQSDGTPAKGEWFTADRLREVIEKEAIKGFNDTLETRVTNKESSK